MWAGHLNDLTNLQYKQVPSNETSQQQRVTFVNPLSSSSKHALRIDKHK